MSRESCRARRAVHRQQPDGCERSSAPRSAHRAGSGRVDRSRERREAELQPRGSLERRRSGPCHRKPALEPRRPPAGAVGASGVAAAAARVRAPIRSPDPGRGCEAGAVYGLAVFPAVRRFRGRQRFVPSGRPGHQRSARARRRCVARGVAPQPGPGAVWGGWISPVSTRFGAGRHDHRALRGRTASGVHPDRRHQSGRRHALSFSGRGGCVGRLRWPPVSTR